MNFCASGWGGVLWWCLPTRHPSLAPSSNILETTASTATLGCQKKGLPKTEVLFDLLLASFQKRTNVYPRMKVDDPVSWKKEKLFTICWPKRSRKSQIVKGTGGILNDSSVALLLTEYLQMRTERIQLKPEIPVNNCERCNGTISTQGVAEMHFI